MFQFIRKQTANQPEPPQNLHFYVKTKKDNVEIHELLIYGAVSLIANIFGGIAGGPVIWHVTLTSALAAGAGGVVGSRLAVKHGNRFVCYVFVTFMIFAALELLL